MTPNRFGCANSVCVGTYTFVNIYVDVRAVQVPVIHLQKLLLLVHQLQQTTFVTSTGTLDLLCEANASRNAFCHRPCTQAT